MCRTHLQPPTRTPEPLPRYGLPPQTQPGRRRTQRRPPLRLRAAQTTHKSEARGHLCKGARWGGGGTSDAGETPTNRTLPGSPLMCEEGGDAWRAMSVGTAQRDQCMVRRGRGERGRQDLKGEPRWVKQLPMSTQVSNVGSKAVEASPTPRTGRPPQHTYPTHVETNTQPSAVPIIVITKPHSSISQQCETRGAPQNPHRHPQGRCAPPTCRDQARRATRAWGWSAPVG